MPLQWTKHAKERWAERLAQINPEHEYYLTKVSKKGTKKHVAKLCPGHAEIMKAGFKGTFYYLVSPEVFWVMAAPETVVTVFPMPENLKRKKKKSKTPSKSP